MQSRDSAVDKRVLDGEAILRQEAQWMEQRVGGLIDADEAESCGRIALAEALQRHDPARSPWGPYVRKKIRWAILTGVHRESRGRGATLGRVLFAADVALRELEDASTGPEPVEESEQLARCGEMLETVACGLEVGLMAFGYEAGISVATPEDEFLSAEKKALLAQAIEQLTGREAILMRSYLGGATLNEMAAAIGVGESRTSKLFAQAQTTLRRRVLKLEALPRALR